MDKVRNSAIILLGLGEELAGNVIKHMSAQEIKSIIDAMNNIGTVSEVELMNALQEFINDSVNVSGIDTGSKEYFKNALINAIGNDKADSISHDLHDEIEDRMDMLKWQPAHNVVDIIQEEHPQVITLTLTYLDSKKASVILKALPKELRIEIINRMTTIGPVSPFAMTLLSDYFEEQFTNSDKYKLVSLGGIDAAAGIISHLDTETETEIISDLSSINSMAAEQIQDKSFPFEKLVELDSKSLQTLLREVSNDDLVFALKGVDEHVRNIFYKNMSAKSAELLQEDIKLKGPVKLAKVIEAEKKIIQIAKNLAAEEKIVLVVRNDQNIVL